MKYHEKLNLRSPIYKYSNNSKTPTKSPLKSPIKQIINPTDLFQKVCCPNCKYGFKIIKQQILKDIAMPSATPTAKNHKKQQKQTQTDEGILTVNNVNINSLSKHAKNHAQISPGQYMFDGTIKSQFSRLNDLLQNENRQNKYLKDSDFKFQPLSVSPSNKKSKSNNLLKTLGTQRIPIVNSAAKQVDNKATQNEKRFQNSKGIENIRQHQASNQKIYNQNEQDQILQNYSQNSNYLNSSFKNTSLDHKNQHQNSIYFNDKIQRNHVKLIVPQHSLQQNSTFKGYTKKSSSGSQILIKQQLKTSQNKNQHNIANTFASNNLANNPQFSQFIVQLALKNQQTENTLKQFQQFYKTACEQIQMPSYCKMLSLTE